MRCSVCDNLMTDKEIQFSDILNTFEPCTTCLDESYDAAYGEDFDDDDIFESYDDEEYIEPVEPEDEDD